MRTETPQTAFWRGEFGDAYTDRNATNPELIRARVALWAEILARLPKPAPARILEVGANVGNNLRALKCLTAAELMALEPNAKARRFLVDDDVVPATHALDGIASAISLPDGAVDLSFTSGVLIHIHPDDLHAACREIHRVSRRFIVAVEYFADHPQEVRYRGHAERLFKRDFGAFWLDSFADLSTVACGFAWQRVTGLDNLTWWVFEKR